MKVTLFFGVIFAAGALGFEFHSWINNGKPLLPKLGRSAFGLPYPSPTPVGYTINSQPLSHTYSQPLYSKPQYESHQYHFQPLSVNYVKPFENVPCSLHITDQTIVDYRNAIYNLTIPMFKKTAELSGGHFVMSPHTIWLTLAAFAEGMDGPNQEYMFRILNLPESFCTRQMYYHLATTREQLTKDIVLGRDRHFIADSNVHVNKKWEDYVKIHNHLETKSVPFKANPIVEIENLKKFYNAHLPNIDLSGNSIILESLDYHGLWTSAFSDATIYEAPFYNSYGEQIGVMEYMKTVRKANIGYVPSLNMKVLELPVGKEGRYRMYIAMSTLNEDYFRTLDKLQPSSVIDAAVSLRQTAVPVEIVIPKMSMTSELNVRHILEELGLHSLWTDPSFTRNISDPAALPSSYIQRVTVTLDNGKVSPALPEYQNFVPAVPSFVSSSYKYPGYPATPLSYSGDYQTFEKTFIANKPFILGFFDSETLTSLFSASFSKLNTY